MRAEDLINDYLVFLNNSVKKSKLDELSLLYQLLNEKFLNGSRVFLAGNGGSAAIVSHATTDLKKLSFKNNKLNIISLVENIPFITATSNDISYDQVFVEAIKNHNITNEDAVICISSSGNSNNLINLLKFCKEKNVKTFSLLGFDGGECLKLTDYSVLFPTKIGHYGPVEDLHMMVFHIYAHLIKNDLFYNETD